MLRAREETRAVSDKSLNINLWKLLALSLKLFSFIFVLIWVKYKEVIGCVLVLYLQRPINFY